MMLTDNETKIDLLNNEAIAPTIIGLPGAKPDHPVTIGVHGDWGAGKHCMLEMIHAEILLNQVFECKSKPLKPARLSFASATSFHTDRKEDHSAI